MNLEYLGILGYYVVVHTYYYAVVKNTNDTMERLRRFTGLHLQVLIRPKADRPMRFPERRSMSTDEAVASSGGDGGV